ncbi:hypothetical protein CUJ84_pRLN3000411 (plasmid) [Rhizobium leguminosarum]|uniref:Uncharacterized protein n=1 Tax=Rhizobium leguminosarum TaxID=384 RepID=A0A2K9ZHL2_RHILE|nr:hypothetical protein CUJ84_pRLN3000411 [Rhizobium leguminosarum]
MIPLCAKGQESKDVADFPRAHVSKMAARDWSIEMAFSNLPGQRYDTIGVAHLIDDIDFDIILADN